MTTLNDIIIELKDSVSALEEVKGNLDSVDDLDGIANHLRGNADELETLANRVRDAQGLLY